MIPKNNLIYKIQVHPVILDLILFYRLIQNGINIEFFREVDKNEKFSKAIFFELVKDGLWVIWSGLYQIQRVRIRQWKRKRSTFLAYGIFRIFKDCHKIKKDASGFCEDH